MIDLGLVVARLLHYAAVTTLAGVSFFPLYALAVRSLNPYDYCQPRLGSRRFHGYSSAYLGDLYSARSLGEVTYLSSQTDHSSSGDEKVVVRQ